MTWQSISTAPKDGIEILASDYDAIEIVSWVAPRFNLIPGDWVNRESKVVFPAWWQPLPGHPPAELIPWRPAMAELLAELTEALASTGEAAAGTFADLLNRARAELAEPEADGPTRRQLMMLADDMGMASVSDAAEYACVAFARWGRATSPPQPVPVSERLPGPEDGDAEGCIWLWDTERRWVRQCREAASSNTWVGASWLPGHALPLP